MPRLKSTIKILWNFCKKRVFNFVRIEESVDYVLWFIYVRDSASGLAYGP